MPKLSHYFTPFQCYVMSEAENDRRRFDLRIGLLILAREAKYRAAEHVPVKDCLSTNSRHFVVIG